MSKQDWSIVNRRQVVRGAGMLAGATAALGVTARTAVEAAEVPAKRLILMGLVQEKDADQKKAFEDWYLGNHIEDTSNCPNVKSVTCFAAKKGFFGDPPAGYLTIYEFEGEDAEAAEKILNAYQSDPKAWDKRLPDNNSMSVVGAGWYLEEVSFG